MPYKDYGAKEVYEQGRLNSYVSNAAAALFRFELARAVHEPKPSAKVLPPTTNLSRTFIWYNARKLEYDSIVPNAECEVRNAMKTLHQNGVCDDDLCQYPDITVDFTQACKDADQEPRPQAIDAAILYCIFSYERLDKKRETKARKRAASHEKDADGL